MEGAADSGFGPGGADGAARTVALASFRFVLDMVRLRRPDRDLIDSLIAAAVLEANLAHVNRDLELQRAYAVAWTPAPDEVRRPVSINAISESLRLPFETVRRRVRRLAERDQCEIVPGGVMIPARAVASPEFLRVVIARHERLGAFYAELKTAGVLTLGPSPEDAPRLDGAAPIRVTGRAISEYMLRATNDLVGLTGDPVKTVLLGEMIHENIAHLDPSQLEAWAADPARLGRPVPAVRVAASTLLAAETARRHVAALRDAGFCRRVPRGYRADPCLGRSRPDAGDRGQSSQCAAPVRPAAGAGRAQRVGRRARC